MDVILPIAGAFILIGVAVLSIILWKKQKKRKIFDLLQLELFLIRLPRTEKEGKDLVQEINNSEQFLNSLLAFKTPIVFEVAIQYVGEDIAFYAAIPGRIRESFTRQVHSVWPYAQVDPVDDYNIFNHSGSALGSSIKLSKPFILPVRTYKDLNSDTANQIVGGLSKVNEIGEGAALQFIIRPAPSSTRSVVTAAINSLKRGKKLSEVLQEANTLSLSDFQEAFGGKLNKKKEDEQIVVDDVAVKSLEEKISKPLAEVNVRIVASAPTREHAETLLQGMMAGFSQFSAPERNEFTTLPPTDSSSFFHKFSFRKFDSTEKIVLNSEELASIFHLPTAFSEISKIQSLKYREVPVSSNLPSEGVIIGKSRYRNMEKDVRITKEDRRRHIYVIGQTGTGKSVFLNNLSRQDIERGEGVCVIDPNGDLFESVLSEVPPERVNDVVVIDPGDLQRPVGLNVLEYDPRFPEQKTLLINELMQVFDTLYDLKTTGGPMFEQYTRNALLLLMDDPSQGHTILEIPRVLADSSFRRQLLSTCKNIIAKDFWEKEAEKAGGEASLANLTPYITSKFNTFIANDYMRPILAQSKSSINFRSLMDEKKILLVNLSKGKIGELNANLLGMILVSKLTVAAFSCTDVPPQDRTDFYLYVDEFHNFTTPSIATILSEARKYRLCLQIAHQFINQIPEEIKRAVFGNIGSIIAFRVGPEDGEYLEKQFEPTFSSSDLINIENLNAHARILVRGEVSTPFNIRISLPPQGDPDIVRSARGHSRQVYGRNREEIESDIYRRLKELPKV